MDKENMRLQKKDKLKRLFIFILKHKPLIIIITTKRLPELQHIMKTFSTWNIN